MYTYIPNPWSSCKAPWRKLQKLQGQNLEVSW